MFCLDLNLFLVLLDRDDGEKSDAGAGYISFAKSRVKSCSEAESKFR